VKFVELDLRRDKDSAPNGRLDVHKRYLDLEELHVKSIPQGLKAALIPSAYHPNEFFCKL
jgi:hypothetical protein